MIKQICIDPGPQESGIVWMHGENPEIASIMDNHAVLDILKHEENAPGELAIEMIASYGMPVGKDVFETCLWIGRFIQAWDGEHHLVYRKDVKMTLCGTTRAKDSNIRQALIDRYGPGKDKAIGKKATPGPLYGVKKHAWAALAVGVTRIETREQKK